MALSPTRVSREPCSVLTPGGTTPPETPPITRGLPAPPYPPGPWGAPSPHALMGGTANRGLVIRVGETVLRPAAPCRRATHALLGHLAAVGFDGAPRVLAAGPFTETLTYIDGHAANLVFREGRAVALIDFDLAGPGSAIWDFAAASRYWAPLLDEQDVTDSRRGRALERFRIFLHAGGLRRADRRRVAEAVVANHDWTYAIVTEAAAGGHQGFADHWCMVAEPTARARRWCQRHQRDLLAAAR